MASATTVTVANQSVPVPYHSCALFRDEEEEYRVLLPFTREGFERGERSVHVTDPTRHSSHRERLVDMIGDSQAEENGKFLLKAWQDLYLLDGRFKMERMLANVEQLLIDGPSEGYPVTRFWCNMEWALEEYPGVEDLVEYECTANLILPQYTGAVVCTYDLRRFPAAVVVDIIRVHPMVIVGSTLQVNPFYTPPEVMLEELRHRRVVA